MNKEDIINYVLSTPANTNPNILRCMLDALDTGGSSDFTTCTVTIINQSEDGYDLFLPQTTESNIYDEPSIYLGAYTAGMQSEDSFTCLLYKGCTLGEFTYDSRPLASKVVTSEAISYDHDANEIRITGDGTITITD